MGQGQGAPSPFPSSLPLVAPPLSLLPRPLHCWDGTVWLFPALVEGWGALGLRGEMEPRRAASGPPGWRPGVGPGSAELVYHLAGALGTELQELARRFGPEAAAGLVPLVMRALELLEKAAVGPAPDSVSHSPLCLPHLRDGKL